MKIFAIIVGILVGVGVGLIIGLNIAPQVRTYVSFESFTKPKRQVTSVDGLWSKVNQERVKRGLGELALRTELNNSAEAKCLDMQSKNYWSHNAPDGTLFWKFIGDTGIRFFKAGENLAYAQRNEAEVVKEWIASPIHRDNMFDPVFKEVGYGVCDFRGTKLTVQHLIS